MRLDFSPFAGWIGDRKELPESSAPRQLVRVMATGAVVGEAPTARPTSVPPTHFGRVADGSASDGAAAMPGTKARARLRRPLMLVVPIVVAALAAAFYLADEPYVSTDDAFVRAAKSNRQCACCRPGGRNCGPRQSSASEQGQVLFRLDPEPYQIAVDQAEARLGSARLQIEGLKATYRQQQAELQSAKDTGGL